MNKFKYFHATSQDEKVKKRENTNSPWNRLKSQQSRKYEIAFCLRLNFVCVCGSNRHPVPLLAVLFPFAWNIPPCTTINHHTIPSRWKFTIKRMKMFVASNAKWVFERSMQKLCNFSVFAPDYIEIVCLGHEHRCAFFGCSFSRFCVSTNPNVVSVSFSLSFSAESEREGERESEQNVCWTLKMLNIVVYIVIMQFLVCVFV